jgi:hypothetical protein
MVNTVDAYVLAKVVHLCRWRGYDVFYRFFTHMYVAGAILQEVYMQPAFGRRNYNARFALR